MASLVLGSLVFLGACSGGEPGGESAGPSSASPRDARFGFYPLSWRPAGPLEQDPSAATEPVVVATLRPNPEQPPWRSFAPGGAKDVELPAERYPRATGPVYATVLVGQGNGKRLEIDLSGIDQRFNEVIVEAQTFTQRGEMVSLEARSDGEVVARSTSGQLHGASGPHPVILSLPGTGGLPHPPDTLSVLFTGVKNDTIAVTSVTLIRRDWAGFLPGLESPGQRMSGDHYRESVGALAGSPLEVEIPETAGGTLEFSIGQVPGMTRARQRLAARVTVRRGDQELASQTFDFGVAPSAARALGWHDCALDLSGAAPGPAVATLEVLSSTGALAGALVEASDLGFLLLSTPALAVRSPDVEVQPVPTVVLITSDTHRADHIGLSEGETLVFTPALDELGRAGVNFVNCYSSTNVTTPSHAALMTGMHPRDIRIVTNRVRLSDQATTLAECYRDAGYVTFAVTSVAHLMDPSSGLGQGFRRMAGPSLVARDAEESVGEARAWLRSAEGLPVFLWLHLFDAHDPYGPPEPFSGKYYPEDQDPRDPSREVNLPSHLIPGWTGGVTDVANFFYAEYRAEIDYLDAELAKLLNEPRVRAGITAFTADHGENFGDHQVWFSHGGLYPSTLHIPLLLRWPGGPAAATSNAPVRQIDIGRTLLDLSGLESVDYPGRDLRWALDEPTLENPRFFLSAHGTEAGIEADGWMLNLSLADHNLMRSGIRRPLGRVELFHIGEDPKGNIDVLQGNLPRAGKMRARLIEWLTTDQGRGLVAEAETSEQLEAMLAELGYAESEREASTDWWQPAKLDSKKWASSPWRLMFEE